MKLSFENIQKSFSGLHVIDNFSRDIEEGELVALVGPSGCGKSYCSRIGNARQRQHAGATPASRMRLLAGGKVDVVLAALAATDPLLRTAAVVPTGYAAAPLAIMRTDTDIRKPEQLKGRTVCFSEGGAYVGSMSARYGAIEKITKAPADSLLALRIGACDAAVHDDTMLNELLKLPEWKKFSARLPLGPRTSLVLIAPAGDADTAAFLKKTARAWSEGRYWVKIRKKWVNDVAFEVYLEQNVPDCH